MKGLQRIISIWLAFCLLFTLLPGQAFAAGEDETAPAATVESTAATEPESVTEPAEETVGVAETTEPVVTDEATLPSEPETEPTVTEETEFAVTEETEIPQPLEEVTVDRQAMLAASESVITTEEAFALIAQDPAGTYTLGASLTLGADTVKALQSCYFTGNLDGDGHTLRFSISETVSGSCGLFSGINGVVQNLNLAADITPGSGVTVKEIGLLAGNFGADAYIYNCTAEGSITVTDPASDSYPILGGLIGNGTGRTEKCKVMVDISLTTGGPGEVGGIVGAMYSGQIVNSHYSGSITLEQTGSSSNYYSITGLTNSSNAGTAVDCTVGGTITANTIAATGRVIGAWNADSSFNNANISLTTAIGSISCAGASGGQETYNTGTVRLTTTDEATSHAYGLELVTGGFNTGDVYANAQTGSITASGLSQCTDSVNEADIVAGNTGGDAFAAGAILAESENINRGTVQANAANGVAMAKGVSGSGSAEKCFNYGAVTATANQGQARAYGIDGCSNSENIGDVTARSQGETSKNSSAAGAGGYCVTNRGSITCVAPDATGVAFAYGIDTDSSYSRNYGAVESSAGNSHAKAKGVDGAFCENYGAVKATSFGPDDADRGSATAYGTGEKGSNSYNTAMVTAVSKHSAARAYGAGDATSVSDGTAYANSEYYEVVTEDGKTGYKMGYAYAGSSLNATAEIYGTAVTSSSGEESKYIYFFFPSDSCVFHAANENPCLTVEAVECGCYHAVGEAAASEQKDYTSQIPTPGEGDEDDGERNPQPEIEEYLDNSVIEINRAGSAYAYYITEPDYSFIFTANGKAGSAKSNDKGILRVPLGTFRDEGLHVVQVAFTYANGQKLDPEIKFSAAVTVASLEFTQDWKVSLDASLAAKLSAGGSVSLGPLEFEATFGQLESGGSIGGTLNVSRTITGDSETLELSTDRKYEMGTSLISGITGKILPADYSVAKVEGKETHALTGTYGIRIHDYSSANQGHQLAVAAYFLEEALRTNPNNLFFLILHQTLAKTAYKNSGCEVIEGSGVEFSLSAQSTINAIEINEIQVFSDLEGGSAITAAYSTKRTSAGEAEKSSSWKFGQNLSTFAHIYPEQSQNIAKLSQEFLGQDITIAAKIDSGNQTVESTSLGASRSEPVYYVLGGHTTSAYDKYILQGSSLSEATEAIPGLGNYANGSILPLSVLDATRLGLYLSANTTPIAYQQEARDRYLYSLPLDFGATIVAGADIGITLSYLEDLGYISASGFGIDDEILLTAECGDLEEEIEWEKLSLKDIVTRALPALQQAAADFFEKAVGTVGAGVEHTWAWIAAKAGSAVDWVVSLTAAPSENNGAWAESTDITVTKPQISAMALRQTIFEAGETEQEFVTAATVGRPFALGVTDNATGESITDLGDEPLEFTIRYAAEDLKAAGIEAGSTAAANSGLAMYRYSDNGDYFEYVGGVHDEKAMTVTAVITKPGQYVLAVDTCAPRLTKLDVSDYRANPTFTAYIDDAAGMDPDGFRFAIDGNLKVGADTVSKYYDAETGVFAYTVPAGQGLKEGNHTLSFTLADFTGNSDTYEFEFTVDLTAPVLSETTMTGNANTGGVLEIRARASDAHLTSVYAMFSKQLSNGTWSEEVRCDMGDMGDGLWGLDYKGEGSTVRVRVVAEDIAQNTSASETYTVSGKVLKTPNEAVAEMTWGANLADLYMSDVERPEGSTTGYIDFEPAAELGMALWFWNYDFHWLTYHGAQRGTFTVSANFPNFDAATPWTGDLFRIGIMTKSTDRTVSVTLKDSKIVKSNGQVIALPSMDKTYTGKTSEGPDMNGWCSYSIYCPAEAPEESAALNGATFYTTVTIEEASLNLTSKADYYFQYQRHSMDQEDLTNVFLRSGANVLRLPVSWTPFVNDTTFEIDREWLEAVKSEVDYILSQGAYCILNLHNDYLQRSFVGTKQNGTWTNLHWERDWMEPQYSEYVNARFAAVWTQIAEYFRDYPEQLIFETCNEPTMEWYSGVNYDTWISTQADRVNELNHLFVETVRNTGSENATRLLCLAVAEYNQYQHLSRLEIPENDPYLMVQLHSYMAMESDPNSGAYQTNYDYRTQTDTLFASVAAFREKHPDVPVIMGEVGITHREPDAVQAPKVDYFFRTAKAHGVPCLWWEDYFVVDANTQYWLYDKSTQEWGRPEILKAIQKNAGTGAAVYSVKCELSENGTVSARPAAGLVQGDTVTLTITPSSGYKLEKLLVNGTNVTAKVSANRYTFSMPARSVTVSAAFAAAHVHSYTQTVTAPTCTKAGFTTHSCTCGHSYVDQEVEPRGHTYDNNVDGTCNVCGIDRAEAEFRIPVHMFRMYNPNTGEHFYTGSEEERANLVKAGWNYEGVGFTFPANTGDPVHRLFQPSTGEHLYTMNEAEKNRLMKQGWNYEGIAFNSAYDTEAVQHRLHNPNATVGAYHFTFSEEEKQNLINTGWEYQGIGWYSCWK